MIGTAIEWATDTIQWLWGCTKVSPACEHCYAEGIDRRLGPQLSTNPGETHWGKDAPRLLRSPKAMEELVKIVSRARKGEWRCDSFDGCGWRGLRLAAGPVHGDEGCCPKCGNQPRRVHERPRVFVNSMSDFFEDRRDLDYSRLVALDAMRLATECDFLLLTKRPESINHLLRRACQESGVKSPLGLWIQEWMCNANPPRNIWLGTTVENQEWADKRIPELLKVAAAVRFLSVEPMLGPVNLELCAPYILMDDESNPGYLNAFNAMCHHPATVRVRPMKEGTAAGINWVICGGESGPHARPMHPDWARSLRDQCAAAGVPFFFKQWGEYEDTGLHGSRDGDRAVWFDGTTSALRGGTFPASREAAVMRRVGKKAAGRLLDGVEYSAFPEVP